jgi:GST-like protein
MIDLYFWPTPNGRKISIMLEETGLEYRVIPLDIGRGDQFSPEFIEISPNNRMPAIVDQNPADGKALSVFESGAILLYLAEKTGQLIPEELRERYEVIQWLVWQVANLGPMAGQLSHFANYASDPDPYALDRYQKEYDRLLGVMDARLQDREFLAGDYSIADIAAFPWVMSYRRFGADLDRFVSLRRWFNVLKTRDAVRRGIDLGKDWKRTELTDDAARRILFGQTAESISTLKTQRRQQRRETQGR